MARQSYNNDVKKLAVLPFVFLGLTAAANAQSARRSELDAAYKELYAGFRSNDIKLIQRFFDKYAHPKFVYIGTGGKRQTRVELLTQFKATISPAMKVTQYAGVIDRVKTKKEQAMVDTTGDWTMIMTPPKGKAQTITGKTVMTDTWVKMPGGWKLRESKVTSEKMKVDGKPVRG